MFRSITTRLILSFLLIGIVVVALASGITWWLTASEFQQFTYDQARGPFRRRDDLLLPDARQLAGRERVLSAAGHGHLPFQRPALIRRGRCRASRGRQTLFFALADENGRIVLPAGNYEMGDVVPQAALDQGSTILVDEVRGWHRSDHREPTPDGRAGGALPSRTNLGLLYAALGGLALALVLGIVLARALTHPIRDLTTAIHSMAAGDFKQQVEIRSQDELGELAAAFNQMSAELDRLQSARRRMTADIAHDLRNPLTVIGGYVESMREGVLEPTPERLQTVQAEVKHLERLVEDLRTISQAEAGELSLNREALSPPGCWKACGIPTGRWPRSSTSRCAWMADAGLPDIRVDPDRMAQVLGNLISNSLRYTPAQGGIVLSAQRHAASVILSVKDTGQGIAPEALPYVFDRFYREDSSRSRGDESGLGLAIAKSIVEAHGGSIAAESAPGLGTTITIKLPV